jgi:hypothetical protein
VSGESVQGRNPKLLLSIVHSRVSGGLSMPFKTLGTVKQMPNCDKIPSNLNSRASKTGPNLPYRLHSLRYNRGSPFSSLLAQDLFIRQAIRNVQGTTGKLARTSVGAVWVRHRGRGVRAGDRRELLKIAAAISQLVKPSIRRRYSMRWPRSRPALPGIAS